MFLFLKLCIFLLIFINSVELKSVECGSKFISKITKLCKHGITEDNVVHLMSTCCSTHCSKAHLKLFCTMKQHFFEPEETKSFVNITMG
uniref:Uncharacterized protein n=1 Tax=Caenorhabditis tropicalis TaxID=1561998 RepID=A0A1I7TV26_9PELO